MGDLWALSVCSTVLCALAVVMYASSLSAVFRAVRDDDRLGAATMLVVRHCALFASTTVHLYLFELAYLACVSPGARVSDPWVITVQAVVVAFALTLLSAAVDWNAYGRSLANLVKAETQAAGAAVSTGSADDAEGTVFIERMRDGSIVIRHVRARAASSSSSPPPTGAGLWPVLLVIQFTFLTMTLGVFGDTQQNSEARVFFAAAGLAVSYGLLLSTALYVLGWVARRIDHRAFSGASDEDETLAWIRRCDRCELVHWMRWTDFVSDAFGFWALLSSAILSPFLVFSVRESSLTMPSAWSVLVQPLYLAIGTTTGSAMAVQCFSARIKHAPRASSSASLYSEY